MGTVAAAHTFHGSHVGHSSGHRLLEQDFTDTSGSSGGDVVPFPLFPHPSFPPSPTHSNPQNIHLHPQHSITDELLPQQLPPMIIVPCTCKTDACRAPVRTGGRFSDHHRSFGEGLSKTENFRSARLKHTSCRGQRASGPTAELLLGRENTGRSPRSLRAFCTAG